MDGDGDLDLVVGNAYSQVNRLYLNNGSADPFNGVTGSNISSDAHNTNSIALGDVDGDSDLDLVAGNASQPNRLYLNNGTADPFNSVDGSNISSDDDYTVSVALFDVDRDGNLDLVAGNYYQAFRLYLNNGTADPFNGVTGGNIVSDALETSSMALSDVNGDGSLDLVAGYFDNLNRVYLQSNHYDTTQGMATSLRVDTESSNILSATLTASAELPINTRVTYYLSNNGGARWNIVQSGVEFTFPTTGMDLRWKAELESLSPILTPRIDQILIEPNNAPTDISLSEDGVDENQPADTAVGIFSTMDADTGNTFTYTLVAGAGDTDNASFNILLDSLRTSEVFDYETKGSYTIRVRSTDQGSLYFEKVFSITVIDANDPPTDISLSEDSVDENQPADTAVGIFSTMDADTGNTFTYTLVAGAGDTDNASFNILLDSLRTSEVFDYETKGSYTIRVRSTDQGGLYFEKVFIITIIDEVIEYYLYLPLITK
jgi:hypothetical protein